MAQKKYLDYAGTSYLWGKIKGQFASKATETNVSTLIGDDTGKSVRSIANEALAAALIPSDAQEALDSLQEIADWIQDHPSEAASMNSAISALESKTQLGTYDNNGVQTEYSTVQAYVEAAVGNVHDFSNVTVLDGITASQVSDWDAAALASHSHSNSTVLNGITASQVSAWDDAASIGHSHSNSAILDGISAADISRWDYIGADDSTSGTLRYRVAQLEADTYVALTTSEIDAIIASASSSASE